MTKPSENQVERWRVYDGGILFSKQTLLNMPIPKTFENFLKENKNSNSLDSLVKQLNNSEKNNLVVKKNTGKIIENIKHDKNL